MISPALNASETGPVYVSAWREDERLRPGRQVFAIGDVHGFSMELEALLQEMAAQSKGKGHLILLGDLIDKGPDSLGVLAVVDRWFNFAENNLFAESTLLIGNHDLFYLTVTADPNLVTSYDRLRALSVWERNGGGQLFDNIGADGPGEIRSKLEKSIGLRAIETYEMGQSHIEIGNLLFVHAGLHPEISIGEMFSHEKLDCYWNNGGDYRHWAWIRFPFLGHEGPYEGGRIVVHGHTPEALVMKWKGLDAEPLHRIDGWRLGLDGTHGTCPTITGAEIMDGKYRIFTMPIVLMDRGNG